MKNRSKIIYDDGRIKDFEEKLDKLDLKDMLSQLYRPGGGREPFRPDTILAVSGLAPFQCCLRSFLSRSKGKSIAG